MASFSQTDEIVITKSPFLHIQVKSTKKPFLLLRFQALLLLILSISHRHAHAHSQPQPQSQALPQPPQLLFSQSDLVLQLPLLHQQGGLHLHKVAAEGKKHKKPTVNIIKMFGVEC